jgi:steroid delta-isomerase-like uncharacterized protein
MTEHMEGNKALVMRHFAVLSGGDPAEWDEIMADDFATHHPFASGRGRDRYRDAAAAYPRVFSDFVSEVQRMIAEDDYVVAHFIARGRHTGDFLGLEATGREFAFSGIAIYRIAEGRLAEAWYAEDALGWFQPLGLLPSDIGSFRRVWESCFRRPPSDRQREVPICDATCGPETEFPERLIRQLLLVGCRQAICRQIAALSVHSARRQPSTVNNRKIPGTPFSS